MNINISKKILNETEKKYLRKFYKALRNGEYIADEDEVFAQCLIDKGNKKYYCPYYFVSNKAKILSVAKSKLKVKKPEHKYIGGKPVCDVIENTYNGKRQKIKVHRLMALYFMQNKIANVKDFVKGKAGIVHHIQPWRKEKTSEENNRLNNLQITTLKEHSEVHGFGKSIFKMEKEFEKEIRKNMIPFYALTEDQFIYLLSTNCRAKKYVVTKNDDGSNYACHIC